jgi:hypothetical protein
VEFADHVSTTDVYSDYSGHNTDGGCHSSLTTGTIAQCCVMEFAVDRSGSTIHDYSSHNTDAG